MLKKILLLFFCCIFLSGCSKNSNIQEISFSSWGSITEVKILNQIIKDFETKNPNTKINFIHIPQNYFQKLHLLFASNTEPDVIFINNLYLPIYQSKLLDLTEEIDSEKFYKQSIDGLSFNNKIYAFPRDISNLVFYINTDKLKNINPNLTLEKILEIATNSITTGEFAISFEEDIYWAQPYLSYFGGTIFDENDNLAITKPESIYAINFYKNLRDKQKIAPTKSQIGSSTLAQMFLDEKIAIYLSGRWMYPKISANAQFNWIITKFPTGKLPQPCDTSGWAISKNTKNKDLALDFARFLSSKESSIFFTQTGLIVPARTDVAKLLNNTTHNESEFLNAINESAPTKVNKNYKKNIDKINLKIFK